ncbi:MAG: ubiquinol-cytochrome c reductase iron-sulfur subunit [Betaproteobacteria bacterium]|nr:ubiquinol-cytochrome c reductase iron-sulfur subunit [Betaproteobacteria bacterium]
MTSDAVDLRRRRFLTATVSVIGAAGVVGAAIPFLASMAPSAKALAAGAPVDVDISKLEPSQLITVAWRGRPVFLLHRTPAQLAVLPTLNGQLRDPLSKEPQQVPYCRNIHRSIKPEYFVCVGICTHLGCIPDYRPQIAPPDLGPNWKGGFFCPCHGSRYDLAGRVFQNVPAPMNLPVMPYYYLSDTVVRVGVSQDGKDGNWQPAIW